MRISLLAFLFGVFIPFPCLASEETWTEWFFRVMGYSTQPSSSVNQNCQTGNDLDASPAQSTKEDTPPAPFYYPLSEKFFELGANCLDFIDSQGKFGPWGEMLEGHLELERFAFMLEDVPAGHGRLQVCPKWNQLSRDQRIHFWVWSFAAIAWDESKCRPSAINRSGSNDVAVGLLQIPDSPKYRSWRGEYCKNIKPSLPQHNLECGLEILAELLKNGQGMYKGQGVLFCPNSKCTSYWQELRTPNGGSIGERVRDFLPCFSEDE